MSSRKPSTEIRISLFRDFVASKRNAVKGKTETRIPEQDIRQEKETPPEKRKIYPKIETKRNRPVQTEFLHADKIRRRATYRRKMRISAHINGIPYAYR